MSTPELLNYVGGQWLPAGEEWIEVDNPASGEVIARAPRSPAMAVDVAARSAAKAQQEWRRVPPNERAQFLYRLKALLERDFEETARLVTLECGKTLPESRGELQRAIENVEMACGAPSLLQGYLSEDIARGIDELMIRQPVGVCAIITPFNFPGMIPMWFLPYAAVCGNACIVKPSERVPLTMDKLMRLIEEAGFPPGVVNLVHGDRETVDAILDHPAVKSVSFVGSTAVAKHIYARAAANGKRVQCQGGAKNPIVVLPDADFEMTAKIAADSAFGCAGQRCLASSLAISVGEAREPFAEAMADIAASRKVGSGLEQGVEMGPVITQASRERIEGLIARAESEGARVRVDGRGASIPGAERGCFVKPTILEDLPFESEVAKTEIFGPVLALMAVDSVEQAIERINTGAYGNMACLFTSSGRAARQFRYEAEAGNIGINVGVAAPMAHFPFSGWKESFFGDLHAQGRDGVQFYTQEKVVVERWPEEWARKF